MRALLHTMAATEWGQETRGGHSWDIDTLLAGRVTCTLFRARAGVTNDKWNAKEPTKKQSLQSLQSFPFRYRL